MSFLYDFDSTIDATNSLNTSRELVSLLQLDASNTIDQVKYQGYVTSASYPGYSAESLSDIEQTFESMEAAYLSMLVQIQTVNNLMNLTMYVKNSSAAENKRTGLLRDGTVNNVYKMRQIYLGNKYSIAYNKYVIGILQFTIAIQSIAVLIGIGLIKGIFRPTTAIILMCVIYAIYLISLVLAYRSMLNRRKDDWTKFYFNNPASDSTAISLSPSPSTDAVATVTPNPVAPS